jgi:hypothetical protein
MAYSNLSTYNFNINLDSSLDRNEILYLKDNANNIIKNNDKFIINNNSTFLLKNNISNEIQVNGKISSKERIQINNNINLEYVSLNNFLSLTYLQNTNKININNSNSLNIQSQEFNFNNTNYINSKEITGQLIYNLAGKQNIVGESGVVVSVKESNGKKYFEIEKSGYVEDQQSNNVIQSVNKFKTTDQDTNFTSKDINNKTQFITTRYSGPITTGESINTAAWKYSHKLAIDPSCKLWEIGKTYILIDTTDVDTDVTTQDNILGIPKLNNIGKSRYQMFIDLTGRTWQNQDEITFFIKNSTKLSEFQYRDKIYSFNKKFFTGYGVPNGLSPAPPPAIASSGGVNSKSKLLENVWYALDLTKNNTYMPAASSYYECVTDHTFLNKSIDNYFIAENDAKNLTTAYIRTQISGSAGTGSTYPAGSIGTIGGNITSGGKDGTNSWIYKLPANTSNSLTINSFIDMTNSTTGEKFDDIIRREYISKNGMLYYYQYVIKFPPNSILFLENKFSESSFFTLNRAIDSFNVVWDSNKTPYSQTYNIVYGNNQTPNSLIASNVLHDNCLIFNISSTTNNISFTLKYIGNSDPSRPGVNIWTIN